MSLGLDISNPSKGQTDQFNHIDSFSVPPMSFPSEHLNHPLSESPESATASSSKMRISTRGLHRLQPYEIPDCINSKRMSTGQLVLLEARSPSMSTKSRKEKWNRHNVGKDFNSIYQEARCKGVSRLMYPWTLKPIKLTPQVSNSSSCSSSPVSSPSPRPTSCSENSEDSKLADCKEPSKSEIQDKIWDNFASLALKHDGKSGTWRGVQTKTSTPHSLRVSDFPSEYFRPESAADAAAACPSSHGDRNRGIGKWKPMDQLPFDVKRKTCSQEALTDSDDLQNSSKAMTASNYEDFSPDDVTVDELSAYLEDYLCLPKRMSSMAEMMYT